MNYREIYRKIRTQLEEAGCDSPAFEASCLLEQFSGLSHADLPLHGEEEVTEPVYSKLDAAVKQRMNGRPLQYILGEWDFLSLTLEVGEGVLIPRPDTEFLCETAADLLIDHPKPRILDLCAGSGCVGLGIASLCPDAAVTAVELSDQALDFLKRNCARYPAIQVTPVQADVLNEAFLFSGPYEAIVSNPPYIPQRDLPSLMREVQYEPRMALDGGDGFKFYRAILSGWIDKLVPGGFCAVEVGIGQAETVAVMMEAAGLRGIQIKRDLGEIDRIVVGFNDRDK